MKPTFLHQDAPLFTAMIQTPTPEKAIRTIHRALLEGATALGLQTCRLLPEYRNQETYRRIFAELEKRPIYVTNYRLGTNEGASEEEIAQGMLELAAAGATLVDVMADLYDPQPGELTRNPEAIRRQQALIENIHRLGGEVLMSSHVKQYLPAEEVLAIAGEHVKRGADIVKIVTGADTMEQQMENLRITALLKKELPAPFLFLSGGECHIHRMMGPMLGCCMYLCVQEHDDMSTPMQPVLKQVKTFWENF